MRLSKNGAADIRAHEGFIYHWYLDPVGIPTIGVGFTWRSAAFREWWDRHRPGQAFQKGATMTRAEADDCLVYLADAEYGSAVNKFMAGKVLPQNVFDAAVSMVFNCGPGALGWSWAALMKAGDYAGAAAKLRTTAVTAQGKRLAGLVARRADEARLMELGVYATGGKVYPTMPEDHALSDGILKLGERGEAVRNLQAALGNAGFQPGRVDGIFGHGTRAAVLAFQKSKGLVEDGLAGPATRKALGL